MMGKHLGALPSVTAMLLLALAGGCATRQDVNALRNDLATKDEVAAVHADISGLLTSIEGLAAARASAAPPAEYQDIRSDIAALRTAIVAQGKTRSTATAEAAVITGPPPAGYQKVSTLAKLPEFIPGLGILYVRPQTLPAGPFLGYDRRGRLVNTVYMIPVADITQHRTFEHLAAGGGAVKEVDFYYTPGHPGLDQPHYHVVLWHVPLAAAELE